MNLKYKISIIALLLVGSFILAPYPGLISEILAIDWKTYASKEYGFSVEYPSNWIVSEKTNRFDKDPFVLINSKVGESPTFGLINIAPNPPVTDIQFMTDMSASSVSMLPGTRIIEGSNITKYGIDGERAGSFTAAADIEHMPDVYMVQELLVTIHENKMYLFSYMASSDVFDYLLQNEIRNHMFKSIKWIN